MLTFARLAAGAAILAPMAAGAQEVGTASEGLAYARRVCAECHAVEAGELVSPGFGAPSFTTIANTEDMTAPSLNVLLQTPHETMPNLFLSRREMDDVIAYIMGLREKP